MHFVAGLLGLYASTVALATGAYYGSTFAIAYNGGESADLAAQFPSLARLADGSSKLISLFQYGNVSGSALTVGCIESTDGTGTVGTWTTPVTVYDPGGSIGATPGIASKNASTLIAALNIQPDGLHSNNLVLMGTIGGSNTCSGISWSAGSAIVTPSGFKNQGWFFNNAPLVLANGDCLYGFYGTDASNDSWYNVAVMKQTACAGTPSLLATIATGSAGNSSSETVFVQVPNGYPNAGRVITIIRHDKTPTTAGTGFDLSTSDDNGATWTAPVNVISTSAPNDGSNENYQGRPSLSFVKLGTNGALFLMSRWARFSGEIGTPQTMYAVSWDQGATWTAPAPARYGQDTKAVIGSQVPSNFWYASTLANVDNTVSAIVARGGNCGNPCGYPGMNFLTYQNFVLVP